MCPRQCLDKLGVSKHSNMRSLVLVAIFSSAQWALGRAGIFYDSNWLSKLLASGEPLTVSKIEVRVQICIGACIFLILIQFTFEKELLNEG